MALHYGHLLNEVCTGHQSQFLYLFLALLSLSFMQRLHPTRLRPNDFSAIIAIRSSYVVERSHEELVTIG